VCTQSFKLSKQVLEWENSELISKLCCLIERGETDLVRKEGLKVFIAMLESSIQFPKEISHKISNLNCSSNVQSWSNQTLKLFQTL